MVYQLDFKLTVEKQFRDGLERMAKLYGVRVGELYRVLMLSLTMSLFVGRRRQEVPFRCRAQARRELTEDAPAQQCFEKVQELGCHGRPR